MQKTRSVRVALLVGALAAVVAAGTVVASDGNRNNGDGDHGNNGNARILDATLAGIPASMVGKTLDGVVGGGKAWRIDSGEAKLSVDGRLKVEVEGLVLVATGANPIATGRAIVSCGDAMAAMSDPVPFSTNGNAEVDTMVSLPASCLAPVIFFGTDNANAAGGVVWFAVTGF
jgi:hypothetical protein